MVHSVGNDPWGRFVVACLTRYFEVLPFVDRCCPVWVNIHVMNYPYQFLSKTRCFPNASKFFAAPVQVATTKRLPHNECSAILSFLPDCLFVHFLYLSGSILLWKYSEFTFSSILAGNLQIDSLLFSKILGTVGIEIKFNLTNWFIIGRTFLWHFEWSVMLFLASRPRTFFKMYLWHDLFLPKITLEDCTWKLFNDFY